VSSLRLLITISACHWWKVHASEIFFLIFVIMCLDGAW